MADCLFCKIASGAIPSRKVLDTDTLTAFHDIRPQAPVHVQIIPKRHIASVNDLTPDQAGLVSDMILAARKLAGDLLIADRGYRLVFNCGPDSGQEVYHLHLHLLGGRPFTWPPG